MLLSAASGCKVPAFLRDERANQPVRRLRVSGSQIPVETLKSWAEKCRRYNFEIEIVGQTDHDMFGPLGLNRGDAELSCTSREMGEFELADFKHKHPDREPVCTPVAMRAFALYANPTCPISVVSENQLLGMFKGRLKSFSQFGVDSGEQIHLYGPPKDSAAGYQFARYGNSFLEEPWWLECKDMGEVIKRVASDPNGIGFGPVGDDEDVRVLAVRRDSKSKPYRPTPQAIINGDYSLGWAMHLTTNGPPQGAAKDLIDWLLGPEGREVIRRTETWRPVPLPADGQRRSTRPATTRPGAASDSIG